MVSGSHPCAWSLPRAQTLLRGCIFWYDWSPWSLIARGLSQESHKLASPLTWGKKPDTLHATAVDLAIKGLRAISGRLGPQELVLRLLQRTVGLGTRLRVMWQGRPWPVPTGAGFRVQRQSLHNTHNHDPYRVLSFVSSLQHNRRWQTAASPQFTGSGGNPEVHSNRPWAHSYTAFKQRRLKTSSPGPAQWQPTSLLPGGGSLVTPYSASYLSFDQQTFIACYLIRGLT